MKTLCYLFSALFLLHPVLAQDIPIASSEPNSKLFEEFVEDAKLGSIVFATDNSTYSAAGFTWPWKNTLQFGATRAFRVETPKLDFIWDPQWLSDNSLIFKFGDPNSSYFPYSLALWDTKSAKAQTIAEGLSWKIILPSPIGRFLAYIRGGTEIPLQGGTTPSSLCTYDLQTRTETTWPQGKPLAGTLSWTPNNTLLFSRAPTDEEQKALRADSAKPWHPSIYEADPFNQNVDLRFDKAWRATVSPDDESLTYHSYQNPTLPASANETIDDVAAPTQTTQNGEQGASMFLVVARRDGSQPQLVREEKRGASPIFWLPDNKSFLICETRFAGGSAGSATEVAKTALQVAVDRYGLGSKKLTRVGAFRYIAPQGTNMSEDNTLYKPIKVTRDGRYLVGQLLQFEAPPNNGLMLHALDLQTGKAEVWAHIGSVRGLDWRESP